MAAPTHNGQGPGPRSGKEPTTGRSGTTAAPLN